MLCCGVLVVVAVVVEDPAVQSQPNDPANQRRAQVGQTLLFVRSYTDTLSYHPYPCPHHTTPHVSSSPTKPPPSQSTAPPHPYVPAQVRLRTHAPILTKLTTHPPTYTPQRPDTADSPLHLASISTYHTISPTLALCTPFALARSPTRIRCASASKVCDCWFWCWCMKHSACHLRDPPSPPYTPHLGT